MIRSTSLYFSVCNVAYMSRRATPTYNPIIESLNGWMKEEMLIDWNLSKAENVHKTVKQFIHYFNHERLAYALNYKVL